MISEKAREVLLSHYGEEYKWAVDPLNARSNFAAGMPWFGVIIALLYNEMPVPGEKYLPVTHDLYMAEQGKRASIHHGLIKTIKTK